MSNKELRIFLVMHSLTQEDFAKLIGVTRQTISNWCRGLFSIPNWVVDFCKDYKDDMYNPK